MVAEVRHRPRLFFGWKVAIVGAIALALQSTFVGQAFGSYAVVLQNEFGWSTTLIAVAYSFNRAESGVLGPIQGWMVHKYGPRKVVMAGSILMLVGFLWFSRIGSPVWFIASYFTISVGAGMAGWLTLTTETTKWFRVRRSRALSLTTIGSALGVVAAPLVVFMLDSIGWRWTAAISGVIFVVLAFAIAPFVGVTPADKDEPIDGIYMTAEQAATSPVDDGPDFTPREVLRQPSFWYLAFGHATALLVVGSLIAHLPLYLTSEQGFSLVGAGWIVSALGMLQLLGMLLGGVLGDRVDKRWLCAGAMFGHTAGLLLLTFAGDRWMIWAFVVLHGLTWGMRAPLMVAMRADYFGPKVLQYVQGYTSIVLMFAMIGGPLFAGVLADATGSYRIGFTVLALLALTGSIQFMLAKPPQPITRHYEVAQAYDVSAGT